MAASGTKSDIIPLNSSEIEATWHFLSALIRQGIPTRSADLNFRSTLAPNLVEILFRIQKSPLKFGFNGFIARFFAWYVPRDAFRVSGLKKANWEVSVTYVRKRKASILAEVDSSLKMFRRKKMLIHEGGEGGAMKVEESPKILSHLNEIPRKENFDIASPPGNGQHSDSMNSFDYSAIGSDQPNNLSLSFHSLSYFDSRNINYTKEEDTMESYPFITNFACPYKEAIDMSYENNSIDVGLDANIIKEETFQSLELAEFDSRSFFDQSSKVNHTLGEDCDTFSLGLGFIASLPDVHVSERLNETKLDFETSLMDRMLDHNIQSVSTPLAHCNQLVIETINEREFHSKDHKVNICQLEINEAPADSRLTLEFGDLEKNSAAIDELADVEEVEQRNFNKLGIKDHIASVGMQNVIGTNIKSNYKSSTKQQDRIFDVVSTTKRKIKNVNDVNTPSKKNRVDALDRNFADQKLMPTFESFIIQEEEGSGGYGTVYKAQRKEDGKIFAVKCPHANAHSHHVYNELKMLERFGGRNFVIKYECSFKNGDLECFVLEHVEHDRPEVLKKEIGMFELQWYGFCMFRALASLHKQGVVHRDVKPGNFLFSRKVNKGYLIDFNLASDLNQKFCRSGKRKIPSASITSNSLPETKPSSFIHSRKFKDRDILQNFKKEMADESKKSPSSKSSKKKSHKGDTCAFSTVDRSRQGSQTADGSGVTSTKDQTSTKTPVDWLKQPIPYKGRRELINFVHKTMQSPHNLNPVLNVPSSQRKRVAAPMTKTDTRLLILTPMPLHSGGNAIAGAGMFKNKASGKVKREGPCVGTKGFRAPEVLFKSFHQGCKIDIWSAGVTMLYLMIGRAPFGGDPEQNIKEIAKLRGSEDLWEVAKLHNCESSFPVDLLEIGYLKSMELSDWCAKNTRRPEFLELIPESLFDLVDKCLSVNPRRRLSAEEALMHKFFAPCHESIRKQRLLRKVVTTDPSSSSS